MTTPTRHVGHPSRVGHDRARVTSLTPVLILLPPSEGKTAPRRGKPARPRPPRPPRAHRRPRAGARRARRPLRRRPGQGRRRCSASAAPSSTWCSATPASRTRADRPRRPGLHRRPVRRPRLRHPLPRRQAPRDRPGRGHLSALRPGPPGRPDPGVPPLRRRHPPRPRARSPASGATTLGAAVAEAVGTGLLVDLRSGTYAAFWRPAPTLATRVATVRVLHEHERQAQGGQPLQQGHQGPDRPRAARGRRRPAHPRGARRRRCATSAGPSRRASPRRRAPSSTWSSARSERADRGRGERRTVRIEPRRSGDVASVDASPTVASSGSIPHSASMSATIERTCARITSADRSSLCSTCAVARPGR